MSRVALYAFVCLALWGSLGGEWVRAQSTQVVARVEPEKVEEGGEVFFTLEIRGSRQAPEEPPDLRRIPGFVVAAGPSVSSSFQWINGRTSSSRTYRYTLLPQGTGEKTIPAIEVQLGAQTYRTAPLLVEVVPRGTLGGRGKPSSPDPSPFSNPLLRRRLAPPPRQQGAVLVEARADRTEVYPGEQITLEYLVFTQREIAQLSLKEQPTYPGFWVEDLKTDGEYDARTVKREGETFTQYTILKKALFPTNPGELEIPPLAFHFAVRSRSLDPFDSFFFQPTESVYRSSQPLSIKILPLPQEGRPEEFGGAVGRFTLAVTSDRDESRVDDAISLRVTVEGQGNLNTLGQPRLPPLHDFKQYEPTVEESFRIKADKLVGQKTWDYVLIPLAAGRQEIPPVRFAFFDPETRQYRVLESEPIPVQVAKADLSAMPVPAPPDRSEIAVLGSDIRYIKLADERLQDQAEVFLGSRGFYALIGAPLLINASLLLITRLQAVRSGNEKTVRRRRARRMARRRLKRARSRLEQGEAKAFYQEMSSALTAYLADKAGLSPSGLTYDRIEEILEVQGVNREARQRFRGCLETCDFARFAPTSSERAEMDRAYSEASSVIESLEGEVRAS